MAKIINRKEFLAMPANTIYREYKPCIMGDLEIKGDSLDNDFWVQRLDETNTDGTEDIDLCISKNECDYFEVYEYVLIDGKYIKSQDTAVYEVKG